MAPTRNSGRSFYINIGIGVLTHEKRAIPVRAMIIHNYNNSDLITTVRLINVSAYWRLSARIVAATVAQMSQ